MIKRVLSGIQPTGNLHLGNYLGAIYNWVPMQKTHECFFCIVDLHALTAPQDPEVLRRNTREMAATYIAGGIDPQQSSLFIQSHVPGHSELAWLLSCLTPMGWLNRMTQFKEKAGKQKENAPLGLYAYPVLMAADILLYQATHVPVGADQKQHLELARDIANGFNHHYQKDFFIQPEPLILGAATRVMSLRDGTAKMSKSDVSDFSRILLKDSADIIAQKIRKARTDAEPLAFTKEGFEGRPEAMNLVNIYAALTNQSVDQVCMEFGGSFFSKFKQVLTDVLVEKITPLGNQIAALLKDPQYLDTVLTQGAIKARKISEKTLAEVYEIMGIVSFNSMCRDL